jgi:hypothetical protein
VAGNLSVESLGELFAALSRQASSNYGIGSDGRVALYVDEGNRSWCTSSPANDHRAITIEVANIESSEPWAVSDKAMAALIDLCTDICQRNGIKQLIWRADKNSPGNMTVHRWFAPKSCPGGFLYGRHEYIADIVNRRLGVGMGGLLPAPSAPAGVGGTEEAVWDFFKDKGLNNYAVAGLMGNLYAESGLRPDNLQNTFETKLLLSDSAYTAAVDSGRYTNFVYDGAGYGLAQWTFWSRKDGLLKAAKAAKVSIGDLNMQLGFLWKELQGYTGVLAALKKAGSVLDASNCVLTGFEKPADMGAAAQAKRAGYGQVYYDKYAFYTGNVEWAVRKLVDEKIINSPDYWLDNYEKIEHLGRLIFLMGYEKKSAVVGTGIKNAEQAIDKLVACGIVSSPDYWKANYRRLQWLDVLLVQVANRL